MEIIKNRKISFTISSILFSMSVVILLLFGLKPGIDFTGGSLMEVKFSHDRPEILEIQEMLSTLDIGEVAIQPTGDDKMIMRMKFLSEDEHQEVLSKIRESFGAEVQEIEEDLAKAPTDTEILEEEVQIESEADTKALEESLVFELPASEEAPQEVVAEESQVAPAVLEERFETIGPAISAHLRERSMYAAIAVVLAIILYIGYAFKRVSKPVQSWKYGLTAIIALVHDVTITMAVFALLGKFAGVEVGIPFVVALLTIMGYSVNDTIVVFDRVRENLIKRGSDKFDETVNLGVTQSITRSINTSVTTLLVLLSLFFFGGDSIHYFSLTLIIGVLIGTYSSIFLASPLLVVWARLKRR